MMPENRVPEGEPNDRTYYGDAIKMERAILNSVTGTDHSVMMIIGYVLQRDIKGGY
jgi:hypothetical protein